MRRDLRTDLKALARRAALGGAVLLPLLVGEAHAQPVAATGDSMGPVSITPLTAGRHGIANDGAFLNPILTENRTASPTRAASSGMAMKTSSSTSAGGDPQVTLWDEIAPPAPRPVPVDNARAAQGHLASDAAKPTRLH